MRNDFHAGMDQQVRDLAEMAEVTDWMLRGALRALSEGDEDVAEDVIDRDRDVDRRYREAQHDILNLIALQAPVASDLRHLSAMLHVNLHLERMGDYAVNVARMFERSAAYPDAPELTAQLVEMGERAREVGQIAIESFTRLDAEIAESAAEADEAVDRLDLGIFERLVRVASDDETHLEWASRMILVTRNIERYGDHGVDIAEQAIFVVTGSTVELQRNIA